jgi:pimeloyl-ACP methyl ester carboxylesterase
MIEPQRIFVDAEDMRLHCLAWDPQLFYQSQQKPPPAQDIDNIPLVLLHALGATADTWRLVADHLCAQYAVFAFDLRCHGQSDCPQSGYDMITIAEDVIRGMAALGLGKVALVGHGWGARIALALAACHPALVSHLILVDCPHVEPRHWPEMTRERFVEEQTSQEFYESRARFIEMMREEMADFWSPAVECIVNTYVRDLPDGRVAECLRPEYQRQLRAALWEDRALSYYSKLTCPVLLVPAAAQPQPDGELPENLENAEEFAAAKGYMAQQVARMIPRCSVLWMPDTGHEVQLQHPERLAEAIARFVQDSP